MIRTYQKHKHVFDTVAVISFWAILCVVFSSVSVLRPYCVQYPYKELLSALFFMCAVAGSRWIAFPCLFQKGQRAAFWLVSAALLLLSAGAELLLVNNELTVCNPYMKETPGLVFTLFLSLLTRDTGIFSFRMLFALQSYYERRFHNMDGPDCPHTVSLKEETEKEAAVTEEVSSTPLEEPTNERVLITGDTPSPENLSGTQFNDFMQDVLKTIEMNPDHRVPHIIEHLHHDMSPRTVERCIAELKKQGLIEHAGSKKSGGYRVVSTPQDNETIAPTLQEDTVAEEKAAEPTSEK